MTRVLSTAGAAVILCILATPGVACSPDDRYPELCKPAPLAAETPVATEQQQQPVKRARASRVRGGGYARSGRSVRVAGRRAKRKAARFERSRRSVRMVEAAAQADTPRKDQRAPLSAAQRRFRAFISSTPLTQNEIEPWRGPRFQVGHMFEPISPLASVLTRAPEAEAAAQNAASPIAVARVLDAAVVAGHSAIVAEPPAEPAPARVETAVMSRGNDETFDPFSLRGLMLALGGAATLASALRLLIGV